VRPVMALALVVAMLAACGGGAAQPIKVAPGVTQAPSGPTASPGQYQEGY
jgi:hypothetical protein